METRTIKMRKGKSAYDLYQECKQLFPVWCWNEDILKNVTSDRTTDKAYTIKFKDTIEADEDLKNISANYLKEKGITGITLEERLQMELDYFQETGNHLDIKNVTLCSGSRYSGGSVPNVHFYPGTGKVNVNDCHPGHANSNLRSRRVVSKPLNLKSFDPSLLEFSYNGKSYKIIEK